MRVPSSLFLGLLLAASVKAQSTDVTRVFSGNALSTVAQRHMVRLHPAGAGPVLLLAVQRDTQSSPDGEGLHWYRSDDEGASWRHYARIFEDGASGRELHMTADVVAVGDDLAVVWSYDTTVTNFPSDALDSQRRIYFQWWRYDGAGHWIPDARQTVAVPESGRAYHRANLAVDSVGRIWIQGWYRDVCPTSAGVNCADVVRLWVSTDGGASFAEQPDLAELPLLGGGRVISLGNRLMVLWGDYSWDNPAQYAIRDDADPLGEWDGPFVAFPDRDSIYHGAAFNAVADGRGGLHVVYKDRREQLYYRYFDGRAFGARTFVEGDPHWTVQPAITRHGDELYICTNRYSASAGTHQLRSRRLSDGLGTYRVVEGSSNKKYYPTAPERVPANVTRIPCAFTNEAAITRVALQPAEGGDEEPPPPPPPPPPPTDGGQPVTLAFQDGVSPQGYAGTRDAVLLANEPTTNHGSDHYGIADGSPDVATVIAWDLTAIPPDATVTRAELVLRVSNGSPGTYELYAVERAWSESSVTWRSPWATAGAQSSTDRGSTPIGAVGPVSTGTQRISLEVAAVQRWVSDPSRNFGLIVQDYVGSGDGLGFVLSERPAPSERPRLEVTYVLGDSPPPPPPPELPTVTLQVTDPQATESAGDTGRLRFSRTGATEAALTVGYDVSGSAAGGTDYEALSGTVTFPIGAATIEVEVTPINDASAEGAETVTLQLRASSAYLVGAASSGTVTIADDDVAPPPDTEPVTVSFQQGVLPTATYAGARDAAIFSGSPGTNAGEATSVGVDGVPDQSVLMAWDLRSIPSGSVVEEVTLTLEIQNVSAHSYGGYALLRPWEEADVTWTRATAGATWQSPGAKGSGDHDPAQLCSLTANATGPRTFTFTEAGRAAVQRWIDDPAQNHGLLIQELPNSTDGLDWASSESIASKRPRLTIRYRPAR